MRVSALLVVAAFVVVPLASASAEPQILGLVATNAAKPLTCTDTECYVELTSFCMEPGRNSPRHESAYRLLPGNDAVKLKAVTANGDRIDIPAAKASLVSQRGFAAVRLSLPKSVLDDSGARSVAVEVGERTALMPVPAAHHRRPHKPEEVAAASGSNRDIGTELVDRGGTTREIADLMSTLVNALPEAGDVPRDRQLSLWRETLPEPALKGFGRGAVSEAERYYRYCLDKVAEHKPDTLRGCLWRAHDQQVWKLNHRYWNAIPRS